MSDYTDSEFRDLQERSALIAEMANSYAWELLADRANILIGAKQERILSGQLPGHDEYQKEIAFIAGASFVLGLPKMVRQELERELASRSELEMAEELI